MVKRGGPLRIIAFATLVAACAGLSPARADSVLWTRKLPGYVTDLDISRDGGAILLSTAPNRETESGSREYLLMGFDARGKMRWRTKPKAPVKAQAISDDGAFAVVAGYDDTLTAIDPRGRRYAELWSVEASCRPFVLNRSKRVLCYNDDDEDPGVAFQVFDWSGRKLLSYPISHDILALAVSSDERNIAVALTRGQVILFNGEFRPVWQKKVEGEISALDVGPGSAPKVAVLFDSRRQPAQKLAIVQAGAAPAAILPTSERLTRLQFWPERGGTLLGFGHDAKELFARAFQLSSAGVPTEKWKAAEPRSTDCPPLATVTRSGPLLARDPPPKEGAPRHPVLALFDGAGEGLVDYRMGGEDGACLYVQAYAPDAGIIVAATDDGTFSAFQLKKR
ncbi:MAG: PQQ-like beta-propeller repeat protein [Oligoflexia bacterium]|nr:PQQ-like beta-propeller repeat protein [Oligoflexia bacterium]